MWSRPRTRNGTLARYPGSPLIARKLFRPQDRLSALELHPADYRKLRDLFEGDVQVRVTELDGWLALNAYVPPKEKRGLVLVDPPFEEPGEFARLVEGWPRPTRNGPPASMRSGIRSRSRARSTPSSPTSRRPASPRCCGPS